MADTMQFDLVSPERRLSSLQAREVQIPGSDGDMTAMAGHVPTITTLRPGVLRVVHSGGADEFVVSGGFAEITATNVSVLAEQALTRADLTAEVHDRLVAEAREAVAAAQAAGDSGRLDDASKFLADVTSLRA
ncbi:ATP synthase epsilon chain [Rubellimicrobium mesophilum DSM 19309]|uniref:ATP synthase epsilon chain n=1 Tax=Rubellimicrobium mesophilum DSM 19309 TaxID=442562 RepID=A0A017HV18_9RHOB|nr:F0F1 ATP synthase subunit epsilon [Rubellimicrobium mesophilum]EYD77569.1 ATP synthase epsilon chain [Rubellimicrobium mesophilum DSM 19309]